jgi:murein L,D-transpeptidase YafK
MKLLLLLLPLLLFDTGNRPNAYREGQLVFTRVREAYNHKEKSVAKNIVEQGLSRDSLRIYLRAFKVEMEMEVWAKNCSDSTYKLIKNFPICAISGSVGPKRRSHDLQAPEGFYHISDLNPYSKYYLSMEVNYPNASDSIRGVRGRLGNEIFIHGDCVSSGCLAITNEKIKELFIYCIEAYNSGQEQIDLTIYPARLTDTIYSKLTAKYGKDKDKLSLWADLKKSYDLFDSTKVPPIVKFLPDGTHEVN